MDVQNVQMGNREKVPHRFGHKTLFQLTCTEMNPPPFHFPHVSVYNPELVEAAPSREKLY
jgi:hypothetical protein